MRKKYDNQNDERITNYFIQCMMKNYIIPSLMLLVVVFTIILLGIQIVSQFFFQYTSIGFIVLICINVLVSISTISIVHTVNTCFYGYKQLVQKKYTVLQLKCLNTRKTLFKRKCTLSDQNEYLLYDYKQFKEIVPGKYCDLIIITNEYGAKLWDIVVSTTIKNK